MTIFEGTIITCDDKNTQARFLVEDKGRILFVGDELPQEYACTRIKRINLGNKALIPSFTDSHMHFASFATFNCGLNVMNAKSNKEIARMLKDFIQTDKSSVTLAFGASEYSVSEKRLITRSELDKVTGEKPVFLIKYDGHACVINSALLTKVKDKIKNLRGFDEQSGQMNQEAFFAVSDYITASIPVFRLIKNMQSAMDYCASKGIGMVHTVSGVGFKGDLDVDMEKCVAKGAQSGFQIRLFMQTLTPSKVLKRALPRIGGCFECALDGCFGSMDAALNKPYARNCGKKDYSGVLYYSDEKVIDFCKKANRAGLQIELHAIGDRAFDQAANAIKAALDDFPREDHRHGIIHACLPTAQSLSICQKYNIQLPVQTSFINWKQEPDEYLEKILGTKRALSLNPIKTFLKKGLIVSCGSDAPCTAPDPLLWIHNAVNNPQTSQQVSVYDALRMCTYNGCYATFDEKERGSLEEGKIADMVVLDKNPFKISKAKIKDIRVEQLYLAGKPYRRQTKPVLLLILSGLFSKKKV